MLDEKIAGVDAGWQPGDPHVDRLGEKHVEDLVGAAAAGGVAVEDEHDPVGVPPQELGMTLAEGGAEHGHDIVDAGLPGREAVGVALDDDRPLGAAHRLASGVEAVEHRALREERRFRGVDVFRNVGVRARQHPAAEGHAPRERVVDREHHPVPKAIVVAAARLSGPLLAFDGQARAGQVHAGDPRRRGLP